MNIKKYKLKNGLTIIQESIEYVQSVTIYAATIDAKLTISWKILLQQFSF